MIPCRSGTVPGGDAARRLVVERNLAAVAFGHLSDAFTALPFEALGPTKALLKRFLSTAAWDPEDDSALAQVVGPGQGWWRRELDADLTLEFGWDEASFRVRLASTAEVDAQGEPPAVDPLDASFDGPVVPEATPNPRTIRFGFAHRVHEGPSRWYESAADVDDPRAARLFSQFQQVANVLVGPDFVAVGLRRPTDWEQLLAPVLEVVAEEFSEPERGGDHAPPAASVVGPPWAGRVGSSTDGRRRTRLEQAWLELGSLRPAEHGDLPRVAAAAVDADPARRQVAASLLREADPTAAATEWSRLATDPVRAVRRAAVDAMVDVGRLELRPLLEGALADHDAWIRWKALRGLADLGAKPSLDAIKARADDPDFRVRLEVSAALRAT